MQLLTATLYRTQRLIRMGEWLDRNGSAISLAFSVIDQAHDALIDSESTDSEVDSATLEIHVLLRALVPLMTELNHGTPWEVDRDLKAVTLHQPYACPDHRYQTVIGDDDKEDNPVTSRWKELSVTEKSAFNALINHVASHSDPVRAELLSRINDARDYHGD